MSKESVHFSWAFPVSAQKIYQMWLDSKGHSEMTGGEAECSSMEGDSFTAWDGYITGKNVELQPNRLIVQTWRTSEFSENDEDSLVSIELIETSEGSTEFNLHHTNIPQGQTQYNHGWIDFYFIPMTEYFK